MSMCVEGTPIEYHREYSLYVKREDLCCPGGPNFSKTRGVFKHVANRNEGLVGVLDTAHSQGGWAVARACKELGRVCNLYYPVKKSERDHDLKIQQRKAKELGAYLVELPAGRSAILYHQAKKSLARAALASYMMPNALKLPETVAETQSEFLRTKLPDVPVILVPASSATIAAGVILAAADIGFDGKIVVHLGYSRSKDAVLKYIKTMSGVFSAFTQVEIIDEGYTYADVARPGETPPWPCNEYYDLKTFRWWMRFGKGMYGKALLWNIG